MFGTTDDIQSAISLFFVHPLLV